MKTEKRKMKGSVLLTVVSVMGLLIIFLSGTLVLATAANRRAHRSYSTSQAELTAKAAIESFTAAMADNEKIAAAVQNLDKTYHPTVSINDPSLGHIGYYDGSTFIENAITVEPLATSGKFVHGKFDLQNPGAEVWKEAQQVKITVTARVGKEEKTVSALLNKVGMSTNVPSDDIGLYSADKAALDTTSGKIYAPFASALTTDGTGTLKILNGSEFYSPIIFVNENAYIDNQSVIHVNQPKQATVIHGDLTFNNNFYVDVNYEMKTDYTQKEIPYLFVGGDISYTAGSGGHWYVGKETGGNYLYSSVSPYNVFAGSIGVANPFTEMQIAGDIYLMDPGKTSRIGRDDSSNRAMYKWADSVFNKTSVQNESRGGNIYSKGNVEFSTFHATGDVRVEGNVDFKKSGAVIDGDLIVGGTISNINNVKVKGTIYNNNLNNTNSGDKLKSGYRKVYGTYVPGGFDGSHYKRVENFVVSNIAYPNISVVKGNNATQNVKYRIVTPDGKHNGNDENIDKSTLESKMAQYGGEMPDYVWGIYVPEKTIEHPEERIKHNEYYTEVKEAYTEVIQKRSFTWWYNGEVPAEKKDDEALQKYSIEEYDANSGYDASQKDQLLYYPVDKDGNEIPGADPVNEIESFFRADIDGNVTDERVPEGQSWTYYLVDVNDVPVVDDAGKNVPIDPTKTAPEDLEYTYYDLLDLDDSGVPKKVPYATVAANEKAGCYEFAIPDPKDPTKKYKSETETSVYVDASNKIVTEAEAIDTAGNGTVKELNEWKALSGDEIYPAKMEKSVIYGSIVGGKFQKSSDSNQFITTIDDMLQKISYNITGDMKFDATKYPTDEPAGITQKYDSPGFMDNGIVKKSCVIYGDVKGKTITISPENEIWVILDNVSLTNEAKIIVDTNAGGDVKFFIKGTLSLDKGKILSTRYIKENSTIRYSDSLHIYYYGAENSKISATNNCLLTGYGRCPETQLDIAVGTGPTTYKYINELGQSFSMNPTWIGNVIYKTTTAKNNLTFALVKEGGGGMSGTIKTGVGYFEYEYYSSN